MAAKVITEPASEPVTIALARQHCRIVAYGSPAAHPDDSYITTILIPMARQWVEQYIQRSLMPQTLEIALDCFESFIDLPGGPVQSITSVKYLKSGAWQTVPPANYSFDNYVEPASLFLNIGYIWPDTDQTPNAVKIQYATGYATVPAPILGALLLLIGHFYENRMENTQYALNEMPMGVCRLLAPYSLRTGL